ncbi:class I tRNA ligase family protein [Kouleothrix sp.]|uniref:class I tRNA ligase family protein n=1 Tax=Kouleothrix sp. TaxID=2779161 RepID=UPI00391B96C7
MPFQDVDSKLAFPALEQTVAQWWAEHNIVKQALAAGDRANPFIFFEGPPTANGRPGVHHVEARVTKDLIVRYQRMRGRYVIGARGGWDTHGLPVEVEVEKELGFNGKPDIEKYGIKEFNARCKESVNRYVDEFERLTDRIAFWLDLEHPYTTYDNSYIESLWWILRQFWDNDLLFRDYKVTMHCPRCGTTLADAEVALGFEDDVDDPSVWVRFRHTPSGHPHDDQLAGAAFLAWTTTPWTLPANVALALKPDADYLLVDYHGAAAPSGWCWLLPSPIACSAKAPTACSRPSAATRSGACATSACSTTCPAPAIPPTSPAPTWPSPTRCLARGRHRHRAHRAGLRRPRDRPHLQPADAVLGRPERHDLRAVRRAGLWRAVLQNG